jgi:predicted RNA-binding Zn ribbon-like protein
VEPLFLGSHPAVDFLNTSFAPGGETIETIGDGRAFFRWLVAAKLLDEAHASRLLKRLGVKGADTAAAEARKLREWARDWLERWRRAPDRGYEKEIDALNQWLAHGTQHREIVPADKGLKLVLRSQVDGTDELLAILAAQIAALVIEEDASLLRTCAGPDCTLWFLDRTKAHRRLFCSTSTCGNRAKVAAFRERQRSK